MLFRTLRPGLRPWTIAHLLARPSLAVGAITTTACVGILGIQEPMQGVDASTSGASTTDGSTAGVSATDGSTTDASTTDVVQSSIDGTPIGQDSDMDSATAGPGPSCQAGGAGVASCGSAGDSCCTSLEVPGGSYVRTYTSAVDGGATGLADPATVSGFRLDKYDVTVGRFRQYVNYLTVGGGSPPANGAGKHAYLNGGQGLANSASTGDFETGWDATDWDSNIPTGASAASTWNTNLACNTSFATWTPTVAGNESEPINCVTWFEAYAFCIWDSGFLPSEAEWEFAAAGGSAQLKYPWGATPPGTDSTYAIYDCDYPADAGSCTGFVNIAPVGTPELGAGTWGQLDLAGNVFQWTLDWYAATYADPSTDGAYLVATTTRTLRGGNFSEGMSVLVPGYRYDFDPSDRYYGHGARCARAP